MSHCFTSIRNSHIYLPTGSTRGPASVQVSLSTCLLTCSSSKFNLPPKTDRIYSNNLFVVSGTRENENKPAARQTRPKKRKFPQPMEMTIGGTITPMMKLTIQIVAICDPKALCASGSGEYFCGQGQNEGSIKRFRDRFEA